MKRYLLIEANTENEYLHVYEVQKQRSTETLNFSCAPAGCLVLTKRCGPEFYGHLDALLVTKDKIEKAAPIVPDIPQDDLDHRLAQAFADSPQTKGGKPCTS